MTKQFYSSIRSARKKVRGIGRFSTLAVLIWAGLISGHIEAAQHSEKSESVKLLTIGNSFANDSLRFLPQLAKAGGKELVVFRANLGGASLERHATHLSAFQTDPASIEGRPYVSQPDPVTGEKNQLSLIEALEMDEWDYVTIQQVSTQSFRPSTFEPHARILIEAIRKHAPQARIMVHQTWAYREDHPIFNRNDFTPLKMYQQSKAAYHELADRYGLEMIPVGDAYHAARQLPRWTFIPDPDFDYKNPPQEELPDDMHSSLIIGWRWANDRNTGERRFRIDGKHASPAGAYLGASVFYEVIYNDSVLEVDGWLPRGQNAEDAAQLRQIAHQVVAGMQNGDGSP